MKEKINQLIEKINLGKLFFSIILITYFLIFLFDKSLFFMTIKQFWKIVLNVYWVIILVFLFTFIMNLILDEKKIVKYVGKESGFKGWIIAIIAGLISHGPIYLWFPLLSELKDKGMKNELIATFLYNRAIKIPLLPLMIFYFGVNFTIILTIYMLIFSVINGKLVELILRKY